MLRNWPGNNIHVPALPETAGLQTCSSSTSQPLPINMCTHAFCKSVFHYFIDSTTQSHPKGLTKLWMYGHCACINKHACVHQPTRSARPESAIISTVFLERVRLPVRVHITFWENCLVYPEGRDGFSFVIMDAMNWLDLLFLPSFLSLLAFEHFGLLRLLNADGRGGQETWV